MVEKIRQADAPRGCSRALFRLPIRMYQVGWGWMLGSRFIQISHVGRVSGKGRQVVLEVVKSDKLEGIYYVVAAWGAQADWFQNIQANPAVTYQVGQDQYQGRAEVLSRDEASQVFNEFGEKHPFMLQSLMRFLGYKIERDETAYRALAEHLPIVKLTPEESERER